MHFIVQCYSEILQQVNQFLLKNVVYFLECIYLSHMVILDTTELLKWYKRYGFW